MKILKKIFIALLVLFGLFVIVSLFLPSKVKVARATVINAPAAVVFDQINTLKSWKSWSYWDSIDPNMKSVYEGPESGVGAKHSWESNNDSVGVGSLTIMKSEPNKQVLTQLAFGEHASDIIWMISDTTGGVKVNSAIEMDMGFFGRIFPGLMMEGWLGSDFEKSLANLKKHSESLAAQPASSKPAEMKIEQTTYNTQIIASYRMMTSEKAISQDIGASYGKIGEFMGKNKLDYAGPVFAFFHSYSPEKIDMECAIPVNKMAKGEGDIKVREMKGGNAVVAHYYGPYEGTAAAHEAIDKWIKDNNKKVTGSPWEVYVTDPTVEKDTARWLTEVYYPVE